MGLDVNLYAEATPTASELAAAEDFFTARSRLGWADENALHLNDAEWFDRPRVEVSTPARYYGRGYERGDWPSIYGAIRALQAAFPDSKVFYGSDSSDDGTEVTDTHLSELWAHFLGPAGDAYHRSSEILA